jgi:hypothetical protein
MAMFSVKQIIAAALSLSLGAFSAAAWATDDEPSDPTLVHDQAKAVSDSVKRNAKAVADAAKDKARQVAQSAKAVAHEVAAATQEGAQQVAATAKKGAEKAKAAADGDKTSTPP